MASSTQRMVAFCDIMGFSDLVDRMSLEQLCSHYLPLFRRVLDFCLKQTGPPEHTPSLTELREQKRVGIAWFSDTILVYGLDDSDEACRNVIETVGWLIFVTLADRPEMKIRAGVTYGEFHNDESNEIYVGKALVEAYRVEQQQHWTGGALSHKAKDRVLRTDLLPLLYDDYWLIYYCPPLKKGSCAALVSDLVINWTHALHSRWDIPWSDDRAEPSAEDWCKYRDICEKWVNTREFHRKVCRSCRLT